MNGEMKNIFYISRKLMYLYLILYLTSTLFKYTKIWDK